MTNKAHRFTADSHLFEGSPEVVVAVNVKRIQIVSDCRRKQDRFLRNN